MTALNFRIHRKMSEKPKSHMKSDILKKQKL